MIHPKDSPDNIIYPRGQPRPKSQDDKQFPTPTPQPPSSDKTFKAQVQPPSTEQNLIPLTVDQIQGDFAKDIQSFLGHPLPLVREEEWWKNPPIPIDSYYIRPSASMKGAFVLVKRDNEKIIEERVALLFDPNEKKLYLRSLEPARPNQPHQIISAGFLKTYKPVRAEQFFTLVDGYIPLGPAVTRKFIQDHYSQAMLTSIRGSPVSAERGCRLHYLHFKNRDLDEQTYRSYSLINERSEFFIIENVYLFPQYKEIKFFKRKDSDAIYMAYTDSLRESVKKAEDFLGGKIPISDHVFEEASLPLNYEQSLQVLKKAKLPLILDKDPEEADQLLLKQPKWSFCIRPNESQPHALLLVINQGSHLAKINLGITYCEKYEELFFQMGTKSVLAQEYIKDHELKPVDIG